MLAFAVMGEELVYSPCKNGISHPKSVVEEDQASWLTCSHQRAEVIEYMKRGFDLDNNQMWDIDECEMARQYYFSPMERMLAAKISCEDIFFRCDCDGDGSISQEDFEMSYLSCLRNCDRAMLIKRLVLDRMPTDHAFEGKIDTKVDKSVFKNL